MDGMNIMLTNWIKDERNRVICHKLVDQTTFFADTAPAIHILNVCQSDELDWVRSCGNFEELF